MRTSFSGSVRLEYVIICMLISVLNTTQAQQDTIPQQKITIDLQQALQMAKDNYPSIKAKQAGMRSSDFGVKEARSEYIPEFTTQNQALYGTANGVRGAFFPAEGTAIPISGGIQPGGQNWNASFGSFTTLMLDWKFFNFGKVRANVDVAKAERKSATADYENEVFQHLVKVTDAYLLYLIYAKLVFVQENNLKRADVFRTVTCLTSDKSGQKLRKIKRQIHCQLISNFNFMEAGKRQLNGDTLRQANTDEVDTIRKENDDLKLLVAELSLTNRVLKKTLRGSETNE